MYDNHHCHHNHRSYLSSTTKALFPCVSIIGEMSSLDNLRLTNEGGVSRLDVVVGEVNDDDSAFQVGCVVKTTFSALSSSVSVSVSLSFSLSKIVSLRLLLALSPHGPRLLSVPLTVGVLLLLSSTKIPMPTCVVVATVVVMLTDVVVACIVSSFFLTKPYDRRNSYCTGTCRFRHCYCHCLCHHHRCHRHQHRHHQIHIFPSDQIR